MDLGGGFRHRFTRTNPDELLQKSGRTGDFVIDEPLGIALWGSSAVVYKLFLAGMMLASSAAGAAPSVFIPPDSPAWWTAEKAQGRVIGTTAGRVTAAQLSKFIEVTEQFYAYKVCSLATGASDTYVGLDKKTQDEIVQTLKGVQWRVRAPSLAVGALSRRAYYTKRAMIRKIAALLCWSSMLIAQKS